MVQWKGLAFWNLLPEYKGLFMPNTIYEQLRERLDKYSIGFIKTESGVELKILKKMFSKEDAEIYLHMAPFLQKPATIAKNAGKDPEDIAVRLESMASRGLIFRLRKNGKVMFAASPFIVGSYEFQLTRMDKELAELIEQYFTEGFLEKTIGETVAPLRTIPVHQSVETKLNIAPYRDAREIIKTKTKIGLADCICRSQQKLIDKGCDKPLDVCLVFGSHADYYVDNGMAKYIDQETALEVLNRSEKAGLVVQPASTVNPGGMCNCCGDCCGILRALNLMDKPAELVFNDYWARVDVEECTGCEDCMDRCQMSAIQMDEDDIATINLNRCIGCGLCVTTCPAEAIALELKPESLRKQPFESNMDLMMTTAEKRGIEITR